MLPGTLSACMTPLLLVTWLRVLLESAVRLTTLPVSLQIEILRYHAHTYMISDKKRGLLKRAANPPGSESPLEFDLYTLNHAAKVGELEVLWVAEFEKELDRRRIFVNKGSAAFNHFAFFKSKPIARKMSDDSAMIIFGSQSLSERFSLTSDQAGFGLNAFSTKDTILGPNCPTAGPCDRTEKYRIQH